MKKFKLIASVLLTAVLCSAFCFAKPSGQADKTVKPENSSGVESDMKRLPPDKDFPLPAPDDKFVNRISIEAKIKITQKKGVTIYYLETSDGTYAADILPFQGTAEDIINVLKANKGKKLILNGVLHSETGIFQINEIENNEQDTSGIWR